MEWNIKEIASGVVAIVIIGGISIVMLAGILKAIEDVRKKNGIGSKIWYLLKDIFTNAKATRKLHETLEKQNVVLEKVMVKLEKVESEVTIDGGKSVKDKTNHISDMVEEILAERRVFYDLDSVMRFQMSPTGDWYHANPSLLHTFDLSENDVYGRGWENFINRMDMIDTTGESFLHRAIKRGEPMRPTVRMKNQDGEFFKCRYMAYPVKDVKGNVLRFMGQIEIICKDEKE